MQPVKEKLNPRVLVHWLGADGARAGLMSSRACTLHAMKEIESELGIESASKAKRGELVDEIVRVASRRIDKSIAELFEMKEADLIRYFEQAGVERHELLDLLKTLDLDPGKDG